MRPLDANVARFYASIRKTIDTHHQMVLGIPDGQITFAYTIGNTERGLPELLMFGAPPLDAQVILNRLGERMRGLNMPFPSGQKISFGGKFPVKIVNVTDERTCKNDFTVQVGQFYNHENYKVQQVLICDKAGTYPDEFGCLPPFSKCPVLSKPAIILPGHH